MAPRLSPILFASMVSLVTANLPGLAPVAAAAALDAKGEVEAKQATRLYKEGHYEDAAKLFSRLTVEYPELTIFERNLGACFYYLRKPEPALSNLRGYLNHRKDILPDDKAVVERWIDEMETLRVQNAAASSATSVTGPAPGAPPAVPATSSPALQTTPTTAAAAGLDLSSSPPSADATTARTPIYKTWWLWTGVGAVVVAGVVTAVLLAGKSDNLCAGSGNRCEVVQ